MKKRFHLILFYGSLWGIAEATIGFLLHRAAIAFPGIPGFLMFPIAFYFMKKAYNSTSDPYTVFYVSFIAAAIKFVDFLLPSAIAIRIINPAISIIFEGIAVSLVFRFSSLKNTSLNFRSTFIMGVLWRFMFLVHLYIISLFNLPAALITSGIYYTLKFLIFESFINGILIYTFLRVEKDKASFDVKPVFSYGVFVIAIGINLLL